MYFPENFFEDEYRHDFLVPSLMKRAWAAEIEILEVISNICKNTIYSILPTAVRFLVQFDTKASFRGMMILISH